MKEKLMEVIMEKTGLDAGKADQVVDTVLGFLKDNPDQLSGFLGGDAAGDVKDKLGGLLGR